MRCGVVTDGDGKHYDGKTPYLHPHAVCLKCGKIVDVELTAFREAVQQVQEHTGFQITQYRLSFWGTCPGSQQNAIPVFDGSENSETQP